MENSTFYIVHPFTRCAALLLPPNKQYNRRLPNAMEMLLLSIKDRFSRHWNVKFQHTLPLREADFLAKHGGGATIKFHFHHAPHVPFPTLPSNAHVEFHHAPPPALSPTLTLPQDANAEKMDYISELPDCILDHILSMLSMKDLLSTHLLSKRWSNLWHLWRNLSFDQLIVLGSDEELRRAGYIVDVLKDGKTCEHLRLDLLRDEFVRRVDLFIMNFKGEKIDSFVVQIHSNHQWSSIIDQWIRFAISRRVERIDLLFLPRKRHSFDSCYKFPFGLFSESNNSTLNHMHLRHCLVCHPTNPDFLPFTNLRTLELEESDVDEILITNLLSNCLQLEELSLISCKFKSLTLKIVSSSLCHLKLNGWESAASDSWLFLSLDCLKLASLELDMFYWPNYISINAPVLKSINYSNFLTEIPDALALFATLPQLEILTLQILYVHPQVNISLEDTEPLKNLRQLYLCIHTFAVYIGVMRSEENVNISWILAILQACPVLQKLSVMLKGQKFLTTDRDIQDHGMLSHDEIKVIEMGGCVGNWYEIEFAKNVLKYAKRLEQIVLSPYENTHTHDSKSHPKWFQIGRERTREELSQEIDTGRAQVILI